MLRKYLIVLNNCLTVEKRFAIKRIEMRFIKDDQSFNSSNGFIELEYNSIKSERFKS